MEVPHPEARSEERITRDNTGFVFIQEAIMMSAFVRCDGNLFITNLSNMIMNFNASEHPLGCNLQKSRNAYLPSPANPSRGKDMGAHESMRGLGESKSTR
jgi:hypothetical protein